MRNNSHLSPPPFPFERSDLYISGFWCVTSNRARQEQALDNSQYGNFTIMGEGEDQLFGISSSGSGEPDASYFLQNSVIAAMFF
jgi:hypothetical protein